MTAQVQDHIHLLVTTATWNHNATVYHVQMPGYHWKPLTAAVGERGLTGVLHVHRSLNGSGNVLIFHDLELTITATPADFNSLMALSGQSCYFVANLHDDSNPAVRPTDPAQCWKVLLIVGEPTQIGPYQEYWQFPIQLMEDTVS